MNAMDHAKRGDLEFFKEAPLDILLNARDSKGDTVLSIVVYGNHVDCCKEICKRCPSLLCPQPYQGGNTPLHTAAYSGYLDILKILICTCDKVDFEYQHDIEDKGGERADQQKTMMLRTTSHGENAMHKAIHGGQPESIKLLIEADPNNELLRASDNRNNTPLHLAVELKSNYDIASLLIEADPEFPYGANSDGKTPLLRAIEKAEWYNDREMLELILELQPTQSMVSVNEDGWTALHFSVFEGYLDAIGCIIQSCPESSKVRDNEGQNFFHHAVKLGNEEMVKEILEMKEITSTVLNSPDNRGRTPWDVAATSRNESIILYLREDPRVNKNLTMEDEQGDTALHKAVLNNKLEAVKLLVEAAGPNNELLRAGNNKNNTPLHLAVKQQKSSLEIASLLIEADPDFPYGANSDGKTPLLSAIEKAEWYNDREMLELILELQPTQSMVSVNEDGWTALHFSVFEGYLDAIGCIIQSCPESSKVPDNEGQNFFHHAVKLGNEEMVKEILEMKEITSIVLNSPDNRGRTPWYVAAASRNESIILCLREDPRVNKNLTMEDEQGDTALHKAVLNNKLEAVKLLVEAAGPNNKLLRAGNNKNNTPLHLAVKKQKSSLEIASLLIEADPDFPYGANSDGKTPLLSAIEKAEWYNDREMLELILELQPTQSMVSVNEDGWTALHYSVSEGYLDAIGCIIQSCPESSKVPDNEGQNFFHHAVKLGNEETVKEILSIEEITSTVLNSPDNLGRTPWDIAAVSRNESLILCLHEDPRVNKKLTMENEQGDTALHKAVSNNKLEAVKLLVEAAGPNNELLRAGNNKNNTPLHLAVKQQKSSLEIASLLIEADPDFPYGANSDGKTPLLSAIEKAEWYNDREMLELILELQPTQSMVSVNEDGWTALHYSVSEGYLDAIGCIIQSCPESSKVPDNEGQNFFHHAVKLGNVEMVKEILGMEEITSTVLNIPDNLGRTPWDIATVSRNECIILCLHEDPRVIKM